VRPFYGVGIVPIYEFRCENCGEVFDRMVSFDNVQYFIIDDADGTSKWKTRYENINCAECGSDRCLRLFSGFNFRIG